MFILRDIGANSSQSLSSAEAVQRSIGRVATLEQEAAAQSLKEMTGAAALHCS